VSELGPQLDRFSVRNMARLRHNSSVIETTSNASKVEPMIKQMQLRKEYITKKGGFKIPDL
jgi:hypothetical protein